MSWHKEQGDRLQREADQLAGNGGAGSIPHWNLLNDINRARQEATFEGGGNAPPPIAIFPPPGPLPAYGGYGGTAHEGGVPLGPALWSLCKWALILGTPLALLWAAFAAAAATENQWIGRRSGGGFGRFAAAHAFPGESLSPASRYARSPGLGAQFYACQMQPHCADFGHADTLRAAAMLAEVAKGGDETAARDMCLMPLLAGSSNQSIDQARSYCKWALRVRPNSAEAKRIDASLNGSAWVSLASFGQGMIRTIK